MLIANTKGRVSTLAVDDNLDMHGRNVTNADVVSVNEHVTLVGARLPGKGFRHVERNGWSMSKDNGDVERKFWKDDFSVDSSSRYTGDVESFTWDTANSKLTIPSLAKKIYRNASSGISRVRYVISGSSEVGFYFTGIVAIDSSNNSYQLVCNVSDNTLGLVKNESSSVWGAYSGATTVDVDDGNPHGVIIEYHSGGYIKAWFEEDPAHTVGSLIRTPTTGLTFVVGARGSTKNTNAYIYEITELPSISYADDFTTDTVSGATGRYRAGYPNTYETDCLRLSCSNYNTTALRSYQFGSGNFVATVKALPAAAPVGARVGIIPHGQNLTTQTGTGFTVGVIKTATGWAAGWGNGKNLTSLGTDVPNLVDGDSVVIDVDSDQEHGVAYAYIYKVGNYRSHPDCVAFKFYHTVTTEGQFGFWAYYDGGGYFEISNITIRAESIVGRTNIEVTEPFWFRDDFNNPTSKNRLGNSSILTIDADGLSFTSTGLINRSRLPISDGDYTIVLNYKRTSYTNWGQGGGLYVYDGATYYDLHVTETQNMAGKVGVRKFVNGEFTTTFNDDIEFDVYTQYQDIVYTWNHTTKQLGITVGSNSYTWDLSAITRPVEIGISAQRYATTVNSKFRYIDISGTRVYNKPIHRGAMLESYHDGTQEVVGTTFIDDCQWDRSAEYVSAAGWTHNAVKGYYSNTYDLQRWTKQMFGDGIYSFKVHPVVAAPDDSCPVCAIIFSQGQDTVHFPDNLSYVGACYVLTINPGATTHTLLHTTGVGSGRNVNTSLGAFVFSTAAPAIGTPFDVKIVLENNTMRMFINGVESTNTISLTEGLTSGYFGLGCKYKTPPGSYEFGISDIQIIAASPDATNGIAACIPPIGGGARYGVEEEVYFDIDNEVRYNESVVMATVKTLDPANEGVEMFFGNTTDSSKITTDDTDVEAISLEDTNYKDVVKDIVLNYDDRGDEIKVGVRKTGDNVATVYVETLAVVPKVEVV